MYRSQISAYGGDEADGPDYLYYNADIINNTTDDTANGLAVRDPNIVFNETRDAPLIKDASNYHFSIVRFTMDGPNRDLPLFIPTIQTGTGQTNQNLTVYGLAVTLQTFWQMANGETYQFNTTPPIRFVEYTPETKNPQLAPLPNTMAAQQYQGLYNPATVYKVGDIVASAINVPYGTGAPPYYKVTTPAAWNPKSAYPVGSWVLWNGVGYTNAVPVPYDPAGANPNPQQAVLVWNPNVPVATNPSTNPLFWTITDGAQGNTQDLTTRYYWVYTYEHWLNLVNQTIFNVEDLTLNSTVLSTPKSVMGDLFNKFVQDWTGSGTTDPFPFNTLEDMLNFMGRPPRLEREGNKFVLYGDSDWFGTRLEPFSPSIPAPYTNPNAVVITPLSTLAVPPVSRLFFNTNMYGLFSNFQNTYWNLQVSKAGDGFLNGLPPVTVLYVDGNSYSPGLAVSYIANGKEGAYYPLVPTTPFNNPLLNTPVQWSQSTVNGVVNGYVYQILFPNKFYQNVVDYRLPPYSGTPPLGYVPPEEQKPYWRIEQEQPSDESIWSPISSIVFTSTLLPVKAEQVGQPLSLGTGNLGVSQATAQSAFQPIVTDIALDTSTLGSGAYRSFIYYAPQAEYRLSDFGASKQPIRNIDIQVFWKCRLNAELYPVQMYNLSSVSFKMMFKKKTVDYPGKAYD